MSRNTSKHSAIQAGPAGTSATLTPLRQVLSTQTRDLAAALQAERNTETAAAQDRAPDTPPDSPLPAHCEPCLGLGYRGRYRSRAAGRVWKIETCRACRGTGSRNR